MFCYKYFDFTTQIKIFPRKPTIDMKNNFSTSFIKHSNTPESYCRAWKYCNNRWKGYIDIKFLYISCLRVGVIGNGFSLGKCSLSSHGPLGRERVVQVVSGKCCTSARQYLRQTAHFWMFGAKRTVTLARGVYHEMCHLRLFSPHGTWRTDVEGSIKEAEHTSVPASPNLPLSWENTFKRHFYNFISSACASPILTHLCSYCLRKHWPSSILFSLVCFSVTLPSPKSPVSRYRWCTRAVKTKSQQNTCNKQGESTLLGKHFQNAFRNLIHQERLAASFGVFFFCFSPNLMAWWCDGTKFTPHLKTLGCEKRRCPVTNAGWTWEMDEGKWRGLKTRDLKGPWTIPGIHLHAIRHQWIIH